MGIWNYARKAPALYLAHSRCPLQSHHAPWELTATLCGWPESTSLERGPVCRVLREAQELTPWEGVPWQHPVRWLSPRSAVLQARSWGGGMEEAGLRITVTSRRGCPGPAGGSELMLNLAFNEVPVGHSGTVVSVWTAGSRVCTPPGPSGAGRSVPGKGGARA